MPTHRLLKSPATKRVLYHSGLLGLFHRYRNRRALTVVMFHRVIAADDRRFGTCDPMYTMSTAVFEDCLRFFRKHYNVVSMAQLLDAADGHERLPDRPLHITFDDGWADNAEFSAAPLERAGLPATMFVVSDAVDSEQPFWQERLVIAWRRGVLTPEHCRALWRSAGKAVGEPRFTGPAEDLSPIRSVVARLESLEGPARDALLLGLGATIEDGVRHMITGSQLRAIANGPFTIGAHGKTHTPLLRAPDPESELALSRSALEARLGTPPATMSFPHGSYSPSLVDAARRVGYQLVFTSVPALASIAGPLGRCLPRVSFDEESITDARGVFAPEELALILFRRSISAPSS